MGRYPRGMLNPPHKRPGVLNPPRSTAPPADPFAALYGTGLGQIPLHLRPEDAALDEGGNVTSIPNKGGAGVTFDAGASAAGITRAGNLLSVPSSNVFLNLSTPADLVGTRMFMVAALAVETGNINFAGASDATADGQRTNLRWEATGMRFNAMRWNGTAFENTLLTKTSPLGLGLNLIEIEVASGNARLLVNGAAGGTAPWSAANFLIRRIFAGHALAYFTGTAGDVVSLITDGSPAMDAPIATIRNALAQKHGITLA